MTVYRRFTVYLGVSLLCIALARAIYRKCAVTSTYAQVDAHTSLLSSHINGVVQEVLADAHQEVHQGDLLCLIDDRTYRAEYDRARARYDEDQATLKNAQASWDRARIRFKGGVVAASFRDQAYANREKARADVAQSEAKMQFAAIRLGYTRITAPENGILSSRVAEPGMVVRDGTALFGFVSSSERWVAAKFPEQDIQRIRVGQTARVSLDSYPRTIRGRVLSVSPATEGEEKATPPERASGLFTKVTQWIRVKVLLPSLSDAQRTAIPVGTNAEVRIWFGGGVK